MTAARPRWILALAATVVTFVVLEGIGRWGLPDAPPREDGMVADSTLGWILPAGTTMSWRGTPARINQLGLRGPEPSADGQAVRVLTVGDSSVFGDGVPDNDTLAQQLDRALPANFEVQNGGVPGYTCPQTRTLFDRIRARFVPDVLVIYNMHSDYRRAEPHDRVIVEGQLGPMARSGVGRLLAAGTLWYRILRERPNLDVTQYRACLEDLAMAHLQTGRSTVFLLPITDIDFPDNALYGTPDPSPPGHRLSDYRAAMQAAAAATGGSIVDGPSAVTGAGLNASTALLDEVHPSVSGHGVLAAAVARAIQEAR
jgi:lysophospholipase L1-like esterase